MPVPTKFDLKDAVPLDDATSSGNGAPEKFDMGDAVAIGSPEDLSRGLKGEGVYAMYGKKPTKENPEAVGPIDIPYSRVPDAQQAGYTWFGPSGETYAKDKAAEGKKPSMFGKISEGINHALQPVDNPALVPLMPFQNTNQLRAAGRVFAGLPGYAQDAYKAAMAVHTGEDPGGSQLVDLVDPAKFGENVVNQFRTDWKKDPKLAADNLIGTIIGTIAAGKATHGLTEKVNPTVESAKETVAKTADAGRNAVRDVLGVSKENKKVVDKFGKESQAVRDQHQDATEKTLKARGTVDDANKTAGQQHAEDVETHAAKVRKLAEDHREKVEKAQKKHADALMKHQTETQKTQKENEEALQNHIRQVEEVSKNNEAAKAEMDARQALEQRHESQSAELDQRIEAAEKKATTDTDTAWNQVRAKTAGHDTDISNLQQVAKRAADEADPATSAIFNRIIQGEQSNLPTLSRQTQIVRYVDSSGNTVDPMTMGAPTLESKVKSGEYKVESVPESVNPDDEGYGDLYEAQFGQPPPVGSGPAQFNRLQRWYTYISNKMYGGGRVEGGLYHSYQMVRNAINDAMQDIAKQANAVPDLANARKLHTEKMEAFSDNPSEPTTAASKVKGEVIPKLVKRTKLSENVGKLERYDPKIRELQEQLQQDEERLKKMRSEEELRAAIKPAPTPPAPQPLPEAPVPPDPLKDPDYPEAPKPPTPKDYSEPVANDPLAETPDLHQKSMEVINEKLQQYGKVGAWVLRLIAGGAAKMASHGSLSVFGTDILIGQTAVTLLTHALRSPSVLDWLAKPTAEDLKAIDNLPPQDAARMRQALGALVQEEKRIKPQSANLKMNPVIAAWLAAGTAGQQSLDDLKKEAEKRKPEQQAAPGPQSKAQPTHTHEYDEATGKIIPVNA